MPARRVVIIRTFLPIWLEPRRPRVSGSGLETEVEELLFPLPSSPGSARRRAFFFGVGLLFAAWVGFAFGGAEIENSKRRRQFDQMFRKLHVIEAAGVIQNVSRETEVTDAELDTTE